MAKEFAKSFYKSKAWKRCRTMYAAGVGGLCEHCLRNGIVTAGVILEYPLWTPLERRHANV